MPNAVDAAAVARVDTDLSRIALLFTDLFPDA
jgi:hypothetical protein